MYGPSGPTIEQINNTTGEVLYLHHDQAGSTRLLTGSTGKVEGSYSYSPYGTPEHTGTATTPLGYDAQYTSSDTGLIYMRARTYDPSTAQFLSVDPFVALTGEPYSYAEDDPINKADPSGRCGLVCIGGVVLGGVALATGVGEVVGAGVLIGGISEGTLGVVSGVSGVAAAGLDTNECVSGSAVACIGAGAGAISGGAGLLTGLGVVTGETASGLTALGLPTGALGFLGDLGNTLVPSSALGAPSIEGCG
jgi:RHS repeat-associated protein